MVYTLPYRLSRRAKRSPPWGRARLKNQASCEKPRTSVPNTANGSYASSSGSSYAWRHSRLLFPGHQLRHRERAGITWILAAIAAIFLGWFGNKFSKTHRAYTGYLAERGLTNEDVVEFLKASGRG